MTKLYHRITKKVRGKNVFFKKHTKGKFGMRKNHLIGAYPVIGIRPTIDGRRGKLGVRESLEEQTMNMAKSVAALYRENLKYSDGSPVKVVISDTTIGRVAEAAACAEQFRREGVDITVTVTPCWCYGAETLDIFADGEAVATIREGEEVVVEKAAATVPLVELPGADPFEVLSRKLGWAGSSIR